MKNKFFSLILAVSLIIPCIFMLSACGDKTVDKINVSTEEQIISSISEATKKTILVLQNDIIFSDQLDIDKEIIIDLNGHKISNTEDIWDTDESKYALILVKENGNLTIKGQGEIIAKENDCFAINIVGGNCVIENSTIIGNVTAVQVNTGLLTVNGGIFKIQQLSDAVSTDKYRYTLNCIDENYRNDTANIVVNGGSFYNFNPANNLAEGANTNFASEGVEFELVDGYYVVTNN